MLEPTSTSQCIGRCASLPQSSRGGGGVVVDLHPPHHSTLEAGMQAATICRVQSRRV